MARAKKVLERIYQIGGSTISDGMDCSIYMVVTGEGDIVLIDSGAGPSVPVLLGQIDAAGFDPRKIKALVLTHGHIDHIGGAHEIVEFSKCKIIAHEADVDAIEGHNMEKTAASWYKVNFRPVKVDDIIVGEEGARTVDDTEIHFLHTPGHTPGSMVAWVDIKGQRVLFGQDIHGPFMPEFESDIGDWRRSMKKLLALEPDILCEGHYGIYHGKKNARDFIQGYLDQN